MMHLARRHGEHTPSSTLSLHVTGVRADGYHLIDAEMVSLELHDLLTFDDATGATYRLDSTRPARSPTGCPLDGSNLVARALELAEPAPLTSRSTSGSPTAVGSVADRPTPRPRFAGPASAPSDRATSLSGPLRSAPTSRSASSAVGPG